MFLEGTTCSYENYQGRVWEETPANGERSIACGAGNPNSLYRFCLANGEWTRVYGDCGM